jgi:hypothetical protein
MTFAEQLRSIRARHFLLYTNSSYEETFVSDLKGIADPEKYELFMREKGVTTLVKTPDY